jgi:hypothetical protein
MADLSMTERRLSTTGRDSRLHLAPAYILAFAILAGVVVTFVHGYYFGLINHIEHLPRIYRILDPTYIVGDFTVNVTSGYEPRFYYSHLMALLGRVMSLEAAFLLLVLLANVLTVLVTVHVGRRLFKSEAAGLAGAVLVMSLNATNLGEAGYLFSPGLTPAALVTPLVLFALWQGIGNRPVTCAVLAVLAAFIHPLLGIELGAIGVGSAFFASLFGIGRDDRKPLCRQLVLSVLAGLGLILFAFAVWFRPQQQIFTNRQFIDLYGWLRAPHHIIPSAFPFRDYASLALLLVLAAAAWTFWRRQSDIDRSCSLRLVPPAVITLVLFLCGWLFVEVIPSRTVAALQLFRLTLVLKWLGLMLLGGAVVVATSRSRGAAKRVALALAGVAILVLMLWLGRGNALREGTTFVALALLAAAFQVRPAVLRFAGALVVAIAVLVMAFAGPGPYRPGRPVFTIEAGHDPSDAVARFAGLNTPSQAVFVAPPMFGRFRLTARRALVIDFKNFVFSDSAMAGWLGRMLDCYGKTQKRGFYAAGEMDWRYHGIPEGRLLWLRQKYGATHAVLYADTPCRFPLLYQDDNYKLVEIPDAGPR